VASHCAVSDSYILYVLGVCSVVFNCFWLSIPVQLIAWKDCLQSDLLCVGRYIKRCSFSQLIVLISQILQRQAIACGL